MPPRRMPVVTGTFADGCRPFIVTLVLILVVAYIVYPGGTMSMLDSKPVTPQQKLQACLRSWGASHKDVEEAPDTCPKEPPKDLVSRYTQDGKVGVVIDVKCQSGAKYAQRRFQYTHEFVEEHIRKARGRQWDKYGITDDWFYNSLKSFPLTNLDVVVMGSQTPWYESICITHDAKSCSTIDFQAINSSHPNITTMTLVEYDKTPKQFDAAFSISSFEHDGLGRYGDPLRPEGDLNAMLKMKCIVKPGGLLYLSVPIGLDKVVWNMHRVYGKHRLPLLLEYWKLEGVFGYGFYERYQGNDGKSGHDGGKEAEYQPILVLRNTEGKQSNIAHNNKILEEKCQASKEERFVFPFGLHHANDRICYTPVLSDCKPGEIQPHFW